MDETYIPWNSLIKWTSINFWKISPSLQNSDVVLLYRIGWKMVVNELHLQWILNEFESFIWMKVVTEFLHLRFSFYITQPLYNLTAYLKCDYFQLCLSRLAAGLGVILINTNLKSNPRYFSYIVCSPYETRRA